MLNNNVEFIMYVDDGHRSLQIMYAAIEVHVAKCAPR